MIDAAGMPSGGEFQVNTHTTDDQFVPTVVPQGSGRFIVSWTSQAQDGSGMGIFGQRLCDDQDGDLLCDGGAGPFEVTSPMGGGTLDRSDPLTISPTFTWSAGAYDQFKVFLSPDPGFTKGIRVTSGKGYLTTTSWMPTLKKWRSACAKALAADPATPSLFVMVVGVDRDVASSDPARSAMTPAVEADVAF